MQCALNMRGRKLWGGLFSADNSCHKSNLLERRAVYLGIAAFGRRGCMKIVLPSFMQAAARVSMETLTVSPPGSGNPPLSDGFTSQRKYLISRPSSVRPLRSMCRRKAVERTRVCVCV